MREEFERTELLLGEDALERLSRARVAVFGVGGVGGYVCEALVRCGVGAFDLIDNDQVSESNLNRQIIATYDTLGRDKVDVMKERMLSINPTVEVRTYKSFFLPENEDEFPFGEYDYVVDAVDTVTAKIELVMICQQEGIPIISAMGAGNKIEASAFRVADIYKTKMCPLAKVMRTELKKRGVKKLKVVYSEEKPIRPIERLVGADKSVTGYAKDAVETSDEAIATGDKTQGRRAIPGSLAFVPSTAGLIIAGEVVKDLTGAKGAF